MLLDDSRDIFRNLTEIIAAINEAQKQKVDEYYRINDERALRLLYVTSGWITSGTIFDTPSTIYIFPRSCRIYYDDPIPDDPIMVSTIARYLPYESYINYFPVANIGLNNPANLALPANIFPKEAVYTVKMTIENNINYHQIFFNSDPQRPGDTWARLVYLQEPEEFVYGDPNQNDFGLMLPAEYHFEVCVLAADMLNDIDVDEQERSEPIYQNQFNVINEVGNPSDSIQQLNSKSNNPDSHPKT